MKKRTRVRFSISHMPEIHCAMQMCTLFLLIIQTPSKQVSDCSRFLLGSTVYDGMRAAPHRHQFITDSNSNSGFLAGSLPQFIQSQFQLHNNISLNSVFVRPYTCVTQVEIVTNVDSAKAVHCD